MSRTPRTNIAGWPLIKEPKMTRDYDAEIVRAAEAFGRMYREKAVNALYPETQALLDAVTAKHAKPKLLTAEEAHRIYLDGRATDNEDMQAVLDADRARAIWVIEALQSFTYHQQHGDGGFTAIKVLNIAHVRPALLPPNPLTKRD